MSQLNGNDKRITLFSPKGKNWSVLFEGIITRRDIIKLQRSLLVEFAKVQRRRSIQRLVSAIKPPESTLVLEPTLNATRNPENNNEAKIAISIPDTTNIYNPARK